MSQACRLALIGLFALAAPLALAGPEAGDRSFMIAGSGTSDDSFDEAAYGLAGQLGWFVSDQLELGIRQSINGDYRDEGTSRWAASTRGYADWHFGSGIARPFLGVSLGGVYGKETNNTGAAGLDAGAKWFVKDKTFILTMIEWQWLFDSADDVGETFDDGAFFYTIGIGYNF
ncbi:MAG: hypothetical protein ACNA7W_12595 [Pseudomonadales bacterium]